MVCETGCIGKRTMIEGKKRYTCDTCGSIFKLNAMTGIATVVVNLP